MAMLNPLEKDAFEVVQEGVKLDEVVLFYYGDLLMFDTVLAANMPINTVFLNVGQRIILPPAIVAKVDDVLW